MCIIIYNKQGTLKKEALVNSWLNNPDGAGIMYFYDGQITVIKELTSRKKLVKKYFGIRKQYGEKLPICLHFRIGTSGQKNINNVHPFEISAHGQYVMHNGILSDYVSQGHDLCDTGIFADKMLNNLPAGYLNNGSITDLLSDHCRGSKVLIMDTTGTATLINSHLGFWDAEKNNWYSNNSYEENVYSEIIPFSHSTNWNSDYFTKPKNICKNCGSWLTVCEKARGTCYNCSQQAPPVCAACQIELIYVHEIQRGFCDNCQRNYITD